MTVKCILKEDQEIIVNRFINLHESIDSLSQYYRRSRRTIIRVLEDAGIDPGIHRRPGRRKVITEQMLLDTAVPLNLDQLPVVPFVPRNLSWFQRLIDTVVRRFALSGASGKASSYGSSTAGQFNQR